MASSPARILHPSPQAHALIGVYHPNQLNFCPGCGQSNWYVGRIAAQCGRCETALPLAASVTEHRHAAEPRPAVRVAS